MVENEIAILPLTFIMPNQNGVSSTINIHSNVAIESIKISSPQLYIYIVDGIVRTLLSISVHH